MKPGRGPGDHRLSAAAASRETPQASRRQPSPPRAEEPPVPWHPADSAIQQALERFRNGSDNDRLAVAGLLMNLATEESMTGLILVLRDLPPGEAKTAICQRLGKIDAKAGREFLLGLLLVDADREAARALTEALGTQADDKFIARLVELHDTNPEAAVKDGVLGVIAAASADNAVATLSSIVGDPRSGASEPLVRAACAALAANASPAAVEVLLLKLDGAGMGAAEGELADLVGNITQPQAYHSLLSAAEGNKVASTMPSRVAAINALRNFPTQDTLDALSRLASDQDPRIRAAARKTADACASALSGSKVPK